ncbi:hypothetical protein ACOSQ3_018493 [Xanthoceras sorbifolium]
MADSKDAGKKTMVDMVSVTSEGPTSVDKRNIIPFHSVSLNKTKNSVVRVEDSVSKVEIATDTVKIDNSIAEKGGLDQVDVQITLMDHSPGPSHNRLRLKKIERSPNRSIVFGPSSPIQKLLVNRLRSRNGSKSPVTKSSPLKVKYGNSSYLELGDGGKRRSIVSPEMDRDAGLNATSLCTRAFADLLVLLWIFPWPFLLNFRVLSLPWILR